VNFVRRCPSYVIEMWEFSLLSSEPEKECKHLGQRLGRQVEAKAGEQDWVQCQSIQGYCRQENAESAWARDTAPPCLRPVRGRQPPRHPARHCSQASKDNKFCAQVCSHLR
jgi:hypothetical protein